MLALSPIFPGFEFEYPFPVGPQNQAWDNSDCMHIFDHTTVFLPNFSSSQQPEPQQCDHVWRGESQQSASSVDHIDIGASALAKKLNHNACERERRKKINNLYTTLRALLPSTDHKKKLSIPVPVGRVLKYIPELQKEVEDLNHRKEGLLSKISVLQGGAREFISQEENPKQGNNVKKKKPLSSISVNKSGEREVVVQISIYQRISLSEVLMLLEKDGFCVVDVSSSHTFGGGAFYNIHLWMEESTLTKYEVLNGELLSLIEKQNQLYFYERN